MHASGLNNTAVKRRAWYPWLWVPSLYLAEGLPNAVVVTVAVVMLKNLGLDNSSVAFYTSLLYLPWVIKPFWAPFVDIFSTKRRWILAMQFCMGFGMALVALSLHAPWWLAAVLTALWFTAFCSATHDVAADGFYMLALNESEQAYFVGIRSTFYRLANLLASGGVVWAAGRLLNLGWTAQGAWTALFGAMATFFVLAAIWHRFILPTPDSDRPNKARGARDIMRDFAGSFVTFVKLPHFWISLAFLLLYRLPEAVLCKLVQPFLMDPTAAGGLGLSTEQVGLANGTCGVLGIVAGGILGGVAIGLWGLRKCLWPMALLLTIPSGFYCYLAAYQPDNMVLICIGMALEQFGYGFGFTAYMMYMMRMCEGSAYTTSHYAFCTGIMALGLMVPGLFSGALQQAVGYPTFFAIVMLLCIPTLIISAIVRPYLKN